MHATHKRERGAYPRGIKGLSCRVPQRDRTTSVTSSEPGKYIIRVKFIPPEWNPRYATDVKASMFFVLHSYTDYGRSWLSGRTYASLIRERVMPQVALITASTGRAGLTSTLASVRRARLADEAAQTVAVARPRRAVVVDRQWEHVSKTELL